MAVSRPPSVDAVVRRVDDGSLPRPLIVATARQVIDRFRADPGLDVEAETRRALEGFRRTAPRRVVNATGVILHTNLGRAPWPAEAVAAAGEVAAGYSNVELDAATGERGGRNAAVERLVTLLTGAEAALVVNNNAAAVFLVLLALAPEGRVPVSRGELIEIGGSYRLPELMAAAGSQLIEVGTTNRTRIGDYNQVDDPALVLKVHPSNYRVVGFSADTSLVELAELAGRNDIPLVFDAGSGLLDARTPWLDGPPPAWLRDEPGVRQALEEGADLVLFSGDKLVGGPQAGIIVGRATLVDRLRRHPATRALRVDGATAAGLAATFAVYLEGRGQDVPVWRMATMTAEEIDDRARRVVAEAGIDAGIVDGASTLGAGSAPGAEIPTRLIGLAEGDEAFAALLANDPPILGRKSAGSLVLDLRTVMPADDDAVTAALRRPWR